MLSSAPLEYIIAALCISAIALTISVLSWRVSVRKGQSDAIFKVLDLMEQSRTDRRKLYAMIVDNAQPKSLSQWDTTDIEAADRVVRSFDILGILVLQNMVPRDFFKEFYAYSLYRCWYICEEYVMSERQRRNQETLHKAFAEAAELALSLRPDAALPHLATLSDDTSPPKTPVDRSQP